MAFRHLLIGALAFAVSIAAPQLANGQGKKGPGAASLSRLSQAQMTPFIDTHAHLDFPRLTDADASIAAMIATMDEFKIAKSILMPTPMGGLVGQRTYDVEELLPALRRFPDRIMLMAGPGTLGELYFQKSAAAITEADRAEFRAKADAIARQPVIGFGEIGIVHLSLPLMGDQHPYESVPADHPLLLVLADVAAEHRLAIDVHFDLIPRDMDLPRHLANPQARQPNPDRLTQNLDGFERFLAHNRGANIVWAHVGGEPLATRTPEIVRELLARNSNLYMSFRLVKTTPDLADALDPQGRLKSDWARLIADFPDRFVLGSDAFHQDGAQQRGGTAVGFNNFHRLLTQLAPDLARRLATENVVSIYPRSQIYPHAQTPPAALPADERPAESMPPAPTKGFAKKGKGKGANP